MQVKILKSHERSCGNSSAAVTVTLIYKEEPSFREIGTWKATE